MKELISIVVPCFNEQEALPIFYDTITPILKNLANKYINPFKPKRKHLNAINNIK